MGPFSTLLNDLFSCWRPRHKTPTLLSLKLAFFFPAMTKTTEIRPFSSYRGKLVNFVLQNICFFLCEVFRKVLHHCVTVLELLSINMFLFTRETVVMTRNSEIRMATIFEKTVNPQIKAMINSDQLAGADVLLTDWLECQSEKQDDHSDYETEWSEEEDLSDEGYSEMSPENKELWDSFLNNSDAYSPLCFSCPTEVKASVSDQCDDELVSSNQDSEYKWSEEEDSDWSDEGGDSEMSPENRELWDSFLNNSDPYSPLCFSCPTEVNASDSDQCDDDKLVPCNHQETESEWSEEEDSDWSDEGGDSEMSPENRELWDSFMNNSDPYSPLCFSCPAELKIKASEVKQKHTPSSPTAREVEEHNPDQSTKESAKKVRFSEEVTIHTLEAWGFASQAARDGSCWMEMARDRDRFKKRVEKAVELISPCLTAQHRARVLDRLRSHSDILEVQ
ncbi:protein phosphatase 1 regulatory subunit 15A isoform X3 [Tachysurus fulvidraco]|uniref:Protein DP71L n=1 Tax=Tachysurus fulvidraco TaxID=1234273 RepID=A0A2I7ZPD2_TACFU|nr:protein phosphatase 1 regulatory subunit 15A isoform X3 [Tachysurus fulvidraco]AUS94653.1 protein phosphatase 1 regulatory subunit 15A [Tachysurus fulvidraco]AVV29358.1 protein phosphatase 1 regulatory subunit 15A [Tachysurus fulvidraco]